MPLSPPSPVDTRPLFRPVSSALVDLLKDLASDQWDRPTMAGRWVVRDVVAHLIDLTFRRLSFHRDAMTPPPPPFAIASDADFVRFINHINAEWVGAARRFSPRVLTDLFEKGARELADWFEALPPDAPSLFGVSWAGEQTSEGWFDVAREFTELWHHQQQIRLAVGAPPLADPRFLRAVIAVAVRALPHAYRGVTASPGTSVAVQVSGDAGGPWTLRRDDDRWTLHAGEPAAATCRVRLSDDAAWKLFFNALGGDALTREVHVEGDGSLAHPLTEARAIVI